MILYGISTCDNCKRALKTIQAAGRDVAFRDIRRDPLSEAEIAQLVAAFGGRLVNRQSTTFRAMSEFLKAAEPEVQIAREPTVMKRPVIAHQGRFWLGWDDEVEAALTA